MSVNISAAEPVSAGDFGSAVRLNKKRRGTSPKALSGNRMYIADDMAYLMEESRILLIEDNLSDVFLIKRIIHEANEARNFLFHDAARMIDALSLIDQYDYDLIILDLDLLDIEGTATVAALHAEAPTIPVIVFSGNDDDRLKEEAILCGAKNYFVKQAYNTEQLAQQIDSYLPVTQY